MHCWLVVAGTRIEGEQQEDFITGKELADVLQLSGDCCRTWDVWRPRGGKSWDGGSYSGWYERTGNCK